MRIDKRKNNELREIHIKRGFLPNAEGSALIEVGNTKVICSASIEERVPPFLKETGKGWITAEYSMLPRSTQTRVQRERDKISGRTFEIQRLIGRALRSVVDMTIIGEKTIMVDCDVMQADGGTRTASITGGYIALYDAIKFLRKRDGIKADPIKDFIAAVSVGILNGEKILDLCYSEDSKAEVDMNIVMTGGGRLIEIQGTAESGSFTLSDTLSMLEFAEKGIRQLIEIQKKVLGF